MRSDLSLDALSEKLSDASGQISARDQHDERQVVTDCPSPATSSSKEPSPPYPPSQITCSKAPLMPVPPAKICNRHTAADPNAAVVKDFIYKVPPPLPDNHPSKANAKNRLRCSPCSRCMLCVCTFLLAAALLLAIALLLFYVLAQPRLPRYDIQSLVINKLEFTNRTANEGAGAELVSTQMTMKIVGRNPNKKMGVIFKVMGASVWYDEVLIAEGAMEAAVYQSANSTTMVNMMLHAEMVSMQRDKAARLKKSMPAGLHLSMNTTTHVALKLGAWTSNHATLHGSCNVAVAFPATSSNSQGCNVTVASKGIPLFPFYFSK